MAQTNTAASSGEESLILDTKPPTTALTTLDIVSTQGVLSGGEHKVIEVQEGQITCGAPLVYPELNPLAENGVNPLSKPDVRYYLIKFQFTLHPLKERRVKRLTFRVRLDAAELLALQLIPTRVTTSEEVKKSDNLGISISLSPIGVAKAEAAGKTARSVTYTELKPLITAYGGGESNFYWVFQGADDNPVDEGWKQVAALVSASTSAKELRVSFSWDVELARRFFDMFRDVPVMVKEETRDLALQ